MTMPARIADMAAEMRQWRRHLHQHPERGFDCFDTAQFIAARLRDFGVDQIHEGIAVSGLVALLEGQAPGPTIGLRADMDGLPVQETSGLDYASDVPGLMHGCGHDGHVAMLLGAAKYLAATRNFAGRVAFIFQPAEESGAGGRAMVEAGIMDRFEISQVYALHTSPNDPLGMFLTAPGPMLAAEDGFEITIRGEGGHGALPHLVADPISPAIAIMSAIQSIRGRDIAPADELVVSITRIEAGHADNVIPETALVAGTVRSFSHAARARVEERLDQICRGAAASYGVAVDFDWLQGYPVTVNTPDAVLLAASVAEEIVGRDLVDADVPRSMGSEDFSFMLQARPGAYLFLGQGDSPMLHSPVFDFDDRIAPIGASFFARLVERAQPLPR